MDMLAIIKDVHIGVGDYGSPALWFTTYTSKCSAALQVFGWEDAGKLITKAGVSDVYRLEGMSCIVEEKGYRLIFKGMSEI